VSRSSDGPDAGGPLAALLGALGASAEGLSSAEARRRLAAVGPNEVVPRRSGAVVGELLTLLTDPLVVVLLLASAVSGLLGDVANAAIIVVVVVLSVVLDFAQTYRARRAAERLVEEVTPTATVRRDGVWVEVPRRELVPGDIIRLAAGDRVPADARLLEARDLHVQQAALTGEAMPVEKEAVDLPAAPRRPAEARHLVFLGTSVVSGTATAVIVATGPATAFGDIAARLMTRPPETEFERGLRDFALLVMRTVIFLVLFVLVASALRHRAMLESLLFAVALAVGLTPEFLPMITTVTLARGALRMAGRKVIVKHLAAIENLGSMDVLCSDKTGTLTSGEMRLERSLDPFGAPSDRPRLLAYLNSRYETGIPSPLDAAILRAGGPDVSAYRKLDEIPFDFERRCLSVAVETPGGPLLVTKGAPEPVLDRCRDYEVAGERRPLDAAARDRCRATFETWSGQGYRVLAVAQRAVPRQAAYTTSDERDLTLVGFVAFVDPPMAGVAEAIQDLRRDGVAVKILTGDNELVARHVCARVGLEVGEIVLGDDVDGLGDSALAAVAERVAVFARVSPGQKSRILAALRSRGHVVGFLGDGINDAPSLHAADVGISVANAVDVAKDAADIVLGERNLGVLHAGVVEGRRAFANVMKYLFMGTSSNFGNVFSMAGAALLLPFLPMLPKQVLLNNFLYDLAQVTIPTDRVDEALVRRPRRWDIRLIRNFMLAVGPISSIFDFLTFFVLLRLFEAGPSLFQSGWFVESLATQTLVLFVIRTAGRPWASRPSAALVATTAAVLLVGVLLPFTPLAGPLGFVPLPAGFFAFLAAATLAYLAAVELTKGHLMARLLR
jgi:Mg2+-importing ATPase